MMVCSSWTQTNVGEKPARISIVQSGGYTCLSNLAPEPAGASFRFLQFFRLRQNIQSESLGRQTHSSKESLIVSMIGSRRSGYIELSTAQSENEEELSHFCSQQISLYLPPIAFKRMQNSRFSTFRIYSDTQNIPDIQR